MSAKAKQGVLICVAILAVASANTKVKSEDDRNDLCQLGPIKEGHENSCNARRIVYTFDAASRQCVKFTYGGCFGTRNIFRTRKVCEKTCRHLLKPQEVLEPIKSDEDIVEEPLEEARLELTKEQDKDGVDISKSIKTEETSETSSSDDPSTEPDVDAVSGEAVEALQEDTEEDNMMHRVGVTAETGEDDRNDLCQLGPIKEGHENACNARRIVYTFDAASRQCVKFTYGGCFGTKNIFRTRKVCEKTCGHLLKPQEVMESISSVVEEPLEEARLELTQEEDTSKSIKREDGTEEIVNDICLLGPIQKCRKNICFAWKEVYTFDSATGHCVKFIYGGCFGTRNLFQTRERCEKKCQHLLKPTDSETSEASSSDDTSTEPDADAVSGEALQEDTGEHMMFRGDVTASTAGTANKTVSYNNDDTCFMEPIQRGHRNNCNSRRMVYTFSKTRKMCVRFIYGGCFGTLNLFRSREQCETKCHYLHYLSEPAELAISAVQSGEDVADVASGGVVEELKESEPLEDTARFDGSLSDYYSVRTSLESQIIDHHHSTEHNEDETNSGISVEKYTVENNPHSKENKVSSENSQYYNEDVPNQEEIDMPGSTEEKGPSDDICLLPAIEKGRYNMCYGSFLRFTYDNETGKCEKFVYGGCFGSANLFRTRKICNKRCRHLIKS